VIEERLLTQGEVAAMFRVHSSSVARWAKDGDLPFVYTPSRRRRFRESVVAELLRAQQDVAP
jgi:excisionase family DNA binding protein